VRVWKRHYTTHRRSSGAAARAIMTLLPGADGVLPFS